jgi:hypothetical protein
MATIQFSSESAEPLGAFAGYGASHAHTVATKRSHNFEVYHIASLWCWLFGSSRFQSSRSEGCQTSRECECSSTIQDAGFHSEKPTRRIDSGLKRADVVISAVLVREYRLSDTACLNNFWNLDQLIFEMDQHSFAQKDS